MKVKVFKFNQAYDTHNIPAGWEPFHVFRDAEEWVVFCKATPTR